MIPDRGIQMTASNYGLSGWLCLNLPDEVILRWDLLGPATVKKCGASPQHDLDRQSLMPLLAYIHYRAEAGAPRKWGLSKEELQEFALELGIGDFRMRN